MQYLKISYSVTVSLGREVGMAVSPRLEQSTTSPELEQEHSDGQANEALTHKLTNTTATKQCNDFDIVIVKML